ncbi:hypothetical protein J8C06_06195 [Chloracidobacterium validum]|uniref:Tetratricopeptide repeat-like domain-containing protein n=1 Tax=Chloracidobacterium validum TaxID=2821543 RepID=A0ABX8B6A9_9BACT|nr:hypothetical protein [Chloracidobacterium validum]QUW01967.1 hypothetical protein J8C06_06195 [Chloracidobacterium validum]
MAIGVKLTTTRNKRKAEAKAAAAQAAQAAATPPMTPEREALLRPPAFDLFLQRVRQSVEETELPLAKIGLAILIVAVLSGGAYWWYSYNQAKGEQAFAEALALYNAEVKEPPKEGEPTKEDDPPVAGKKIYTDEKTKYTEAATAFDKAAGYASQSFMSRYYAALSRLKLDPAQGIKELRDLSVTPGAVGQLATLALADAVAAEGKIDEAIEHYKQLREKREQAGANAVVSPEVIAFALGKLYEAKQDPAAAAKEYMIAAKSRSVALIGQQAYQRLAAIDPELARQLPEPKLGDDDSF